VRLASPFVVVTAPYRVYLVDLKMLMNKNKQQKNVIKGIVLFKMAAQTHHAQTYVPPVLARCKEARAHKIFSLAMAADPLISARLGSRGGGGSEGARGEQAAMEQANESQAQRSMPMP